MNLVLQVKTANGGRSATGIKPKDPAVHDGTATPDAMLREGSQAHPADNISDGASVSVQVCCSSTKEQTWY